MEIKVKPDVANELKRLIKTQGNTNIGAKIYISRYSWGGPVFDLALVVPTDKDIITELEGIKFIVDKELAKFIKGVAIEYRFGAPGRGIVVLPLGHNSSSCR